VTRLVVSQTAGAYTEPGVLLFNRQGALIARHLDVSSRTLTGDEVTVADLLSYDTGFAIPGFSVSLNGNIAYRPVERRQLKWFDRQGNTLGVAGEPDANNQFGVDLSADDRRAAVFRTVQDNTDIWAIDTLSRGAERITTDSAGDQFPVWSPDGTQMAFASNRKGTFNIYLKSLIGDEKQLLPESKTLAKFPMDWSNNGEYLLYAAAGDAAAGDKTGYDLWALPMSRAPEAQGRAERERGSAQPQEKAAIVNNASPVGSKPGTTEDWKPIAVSNTQFEEQNGKFSPDGHWVAYQSNATESFQIYVQPFPGPGVRSPVSTAGGTHPRWHPDGKELYFIAPDGNLMAVSFRIQAGSFEAGSPVKLFQTRMATGGMADLSSEYAVAGDGRFIINTRVDDSVITPIVLILNWKFASKNTR
jgi:dipeptidyl aminopeptidase/acylaminoacyl peptidase